MILTRLLAVLAALAAAVVLVASSVAGDGAPRTALRLDGALFRPELAMTPDQRSEGLMNRRVAPADGMLFVFPRDTTGGFWMKNTLVPLSIVFFDRSGRQVRRLAMKPCRSDPCRIYSPERRYRFALELRANDPRPAKNLGPAAKLERLIRAAR